MYRIYTWSLTISQMTSLRIFKAARAIGSEMSLPLYLSFQTFTELLACWYQSSRNHMTIIIF